MISAEFLQISSASKSANGNIDDMSFFLKTDQKTTWNHHLGICFSSIFDVISCRVFADILSYVEVIQYSTKKKILMICLFLWGFFLYLFLFVSFFSSPKDRLESAYKHQHLKILRLSNIF